MVVPNASATQRFGQSSSTKRKPAASTIITGEGTQPNRTREVTLILQADEVADILTLDEVREAVKLGMMEQAGGHVQLPTRLTIDVASGHGWMRLMPAILNQSKFMGFKAMHSTPGVGVRYVVMLYDLETGELLAVIDADWLTSRRTAATAALGADILARPSASTAGVLGSSEQA